jgi:hypothetical protein
MFADRVADIVLASQLAPKAGIVPPASRQGVSVPGDVLQRLAGYYEHAVTGAFRRITVKDGVLLAFGQRFKAIAADRYVGQAPGLELYFPPVSAGKLQEMHIIRDGRDAEVCLRVVPPTGTDFAEFAGTYYSDELEATWTLAARDGRLTVQVLHDPPTDLVIVKPGVFVTEQGVVVRFERDAGRIVRASVEAGRVTNLVFTRR